MLRKILISIITKVLPELTVKKVGLTEVEAIIAGLKKKGVEPGAEVVATTKMMASTLGIGVSITEEAEAEQANLDQEASDNIVHATATEVATQATVDELEAQIKELKQRITKTEEDGTKVAERFRKNAESLQKRSTEIGEVAKLFK